MKFEYILTDDELAGVTKSLEAFNNSKPQEIDNPDYVEPIGEEKIPNPDLIADEESYLNFVFSECFKSYQKQFELNG